MSPLILPAWSEVAARCGRVQRLLVGFSGGVDSTVLLHLARQWSTQSGLPLLAVHVNHQLSPQADRWQAHCESVCAQWGISLHVDKVHVIKRGNGLEAAARNARYEVYACVVQPDDLLLLGHHGDDQVETVFLRLLRGSGVLGLRGMEALSSWHGAKIYRPLLELGKADLVAYARAQGWPWVEDESNLSDAFDRNYLRQRVLPLLAARWPALSKAVDRTARHCHEAQGLLEELAHLDLLPRLGKQGELRLQAIIPTDALSALSAARQRNLLRYWLRCQELPLPSEAQMERILANVIPAANDATPCVSWPGGEVRRFREALYALAPLPAQPMDAVPWSLPASGEQPLVSGGMLRVTAGDSGPGRLSLAKLHDGPPTLRFRQGGERCKLINRPGRPLKKILQESALPPWWRERLPLIYVGETLTLVPGIGVCDGFQAGEGEPGLSVDWSPPVLPQGWRR